MVSIPFYDSGYQVLELVRILAGAVTLFAYDYLLTLDLEVNIISSWRDFALNNGFPYSGLLYGQHLGIWARFCLCLSVLALALEPSASCVNS